MMPVHIRHIVLIKLRPETDEAVGAELIAKLQDLGQQTSGLKEWMIIKSLDTRKGIIIIENALFEDQTAFDIFRSSVAHKEVGDFMKEVADWTIGDYEETMESKLA